MVKMTDLEIKRLDIEKAIMQCQMGCGAAAVNILDSYNKRWNAEPKKIKSKKKTE